MRFDLKKPCKNCPFRTDKTAIRFSGRERAEEIEESAYRNGFPCHLSAIDTSEEDEERGGYTFGEDTQHCAGYIIMRLNEGDTEWPGIDNDEELGERLAMQMNFKSPVFQSTEDFLDENSKAANPIEPKVQETE